MAYSNGLGQRSKIEVSICPDRKIPIATAITPSGTTHKFQFNARHQKMWPLEEKKREVFEKDLFPEYASWSERLQTEVMFAMNQVSDKVEQFVFCTEDGSFKRVDEDQLVYNKEMKSTENCFIMMGCHGKEGEEEDVVIEIGKDGTVKKLVEDDNGKWVPLPGKAVKMLENCDDMDMDDSSYYREDMPTPEIYQKRSYLNGKLETIIYVCFNYNTYKFRFDESSGLMRACQEAPALVEMMDLSPLYSEFSQVLNCHVVHVSNRFNKQMEKYVYSSEIDGLLEVEALDLVYDEKRIGTSHLLFMEDFGEDKKVAVMRFITQFRIEKFCKEKRRFVEFRKIAVKTLMDQRREKREEEHVTPSVDEKEAPDASALPEASMECRPLDIQDQPTPAPMSHDGLMDALEETRSKRVPDRRVSGTTAIKDQSEMLEVEQKKVEHEKQVSTAGDMKDVPTETLTKVQKILEKVVKASTELDQKIAKELLEKERMTEVQIVTKDQKSSSEVAKPPGGVERVQETVQGGVAPGHVAPENSSPEDISSDDEYDVYSQYSETEDEGEEKDTTTTTTTPLTSKIRDLIVNSFFGSDEKKQEE